MVVLKNSGGIRLQPYGITLDNYPEGGGGCMRNVTPPPFVYFKYYTFILEPSHSSPFKNHLKFR